MKFLNFSVYAEGRGLLGLIGHFSSLNDIHLRRQWGEGLRGYRSHSEAARGETPVRLSDEWARRQIGLLDKLQTIKACR